MSRLVILAAGMFTFGFDAYVIAGLIPGISATFGTTASAAGQGVTAFNLCYALSAPVFAALLARVPVRTVLPVALVVFTAGNAATVLAAGLPVFLIGRGVAGIGAGLFIPVAVAAATTMAGERKRGRALSVMLGGHSAGAVVGVPLGLVLADQVGWKGTIALVTVLGVAALGGVAWRPPTVRVTAPPSLATRTRMLADRRVLAVIGVTFLTSTASLGLYTYAAPMAHAAGAGGSVTGYLWAWGIGGVLGTFAIGHLIDRTGRPAALMAVVLAVLVVAVLAVPEVLHLPGLGLLPFLLWGAAGWATPAPQQHVLIGRQPEHAATVVALNGSALYLGGAFGSGLGGLLILGGIGELGLPYAAAGVLLLALVGQIALIPRKTERIGGRDAAG